MGRFIPVFLLATRRRFFVYTSKLINKVIYLFLCFEDKGKSMLQVSSKSRYAVRIMVYLAQHATGGGPARKQDIADAEEISADYVEQILIRLRGGGLVTSHRGARGGFTLAGEAHQIRVLDILEAAEGPLHFVPEEELTSQHPTIVASCRMWCAARDTLVRQLAGVTVADLVAEVEKLKQGTQLMYDI
jgi:Rrf2 family transcriptional regulator, cysteine metabolism repressor